MNTHEEQEAEEKRRRREEEERLTAAYLAWFYDKTGTVPMRPLSADEKRRG